VIVCVFVCAACLCITGILVRANVVPPYSISRNKNMARRTKDLRFNEVNNFDSFITVRLCLHKQSLDSLLFPSFIFSSFYIHSFISNLSYDRSTASSKMIPPLNAI
jgi:hypothetical protein